MSRIFQPKPRVQRQFANDVVGKFRSGHQLSNKPIPLKEWRVTTGDPDVASAITGLLGGDEPQEWDTKGDDNLEVFTTSSSLDIILSTEKGVDAHMYIWPRGQKRIVTCDGDVVEVDGRKPYECNSGDFSNKKEYEGQGHACEPQVRVRFRLADVPDLGIFEFTSGAWSLVTEVGNILYELQGIAEDHEVTEARAKLILEPVEYESQGQTRRFTKPVIKILGPAE